MSARREGEEGLAALFKGQTFYVSQWVPDRNALMRKIKEYGGDLAVLEAKADVTIADHSRADAPMGSVSHRYILNSCMNGVNNGYDGYIKATRNGVVLGSALKKGRIPFTPEDDEILIDFVKYHPNKSGNAIYKELETEHPQHTWQSWRNRWVKKLQADSVLSNRPQSSSRKPRSQPPTTVPAEKLQPPKTRPAPTRPSNVRLPSSSREPRHVVPSSPPETEVEVPGIDATEVNAVVQEQNIDTVASEPQLPSLLPFLPTEIADPEPEPEPELEPESAPKAPPPQYAFVDPPIIPFVTPQHQRIVNIAGTGGSNAIPDYNDDESPSVMALRMRTTSSHKKRQIWTLREELRLEEAVAAHVRSGGDWRDDVVYKGHFEKELARNGKSKYTWENMRRHFKELVELQKVDMTEWDVDSQADTESESDDEQPVEPEAGREVAETEIPESDVQTGHSWGLEAEQQLQNEAEMGVKKDEEEEEEEEEEEDYYLDAPLFLNMKNFQSPTPISRFTPASQHVATPATVRSRPTIAMEITKSKPQVSPPTTAAATEMDRCWREPLEWADIEKDAKRYHAIAIKSQGRVQTFADIMGSRIETINLYKAVIKQRLPPKEVDWLTVAQHLDLEWLMIDENELISNIRDCWNKNVVPVLGIMKESDRHGVDGETDATADDFDSDADTSISDAHQLQPPTAVEILASDPESKTPQSSPEPILRHRRQKIRAITDVIPSTPDITTPVKSAPKKILPASVIFSVKRKAAEPLTQDYNIDVSPEQQLQSETDAYSPCKKKVRDIEMQDVLAMNGIEDNPRSDYRVDLTRASPEIRPSSSFALPKPQQKRPKHQHSSLIQAPLRIPAPASAPAPTSAFSFAPTANHALTHVPTKTPSRLPAKPHKRSLPPLFSSRVHSSSTSRQSSLFPHLQPSARQQPRRRCKRTTGIVGRNYVNPSSRPTTAQKPIAPNTGVARRPGTSVAPSTVVTSRHVQESDDPLTAFYEKWTGEGYPGQYVKKALFYTTFNAGRLAYDVMKSLKRGRGVPQDVPGVWTEEDDQALRKYDSPAMMFEDGLSEVQMSERQNIKERFRGLIQKHGQHAVEMRLDFLEKHADFNHPY